MTQHSPANHFLRPERVIDGFIAHTSADRADLLSGEHRTRNITLARQQLMWLLRDLTPATLETIGRLVGDRSPATVAEGIDRVSDMIALNDDFRRAMQHARAACIMAATSGGVRVDSRIGDGRGIFARVIAAQGVLSDDMLSDADARHAARSILSGLMPQTVEAEHG